jgi:hypothetical protein
LEQECRTYARYLTGRSPEPYVVAKYLECHAVCGARVAPADSFDRWLTEASARGPFRARLADTYASRFLKQAAVRRKLVLMLALLECSPRSFASLDAAGGGGLPGTFVSLAFGAALYAGVLALAVLVFLPAQASMAVLGRTGKVPAMES